jgi:hypothetical protein
MKARPKYIENAAIQKYDPIRPIGTNDVSTIGNIIARINNKENIPPNKGNNINSLSFLITSKQSLVISQLRSKAFIVSHPQIKTNKRK